MNSTTSSTEALSSLFTSINCGNASTIIMLYDWLLCLDREVAYIWKAATGLNAGSLVYALSRFPLMMSLVFSFVTIFPLSTLGCRFAIWAGVFLLLLSCLSVSMFSVFRVYAVSGGKIIPTLVVSLLSTVQIIMSLIMYAGFSTVENLPSPFNCSQTIQLSSQWTFRFTAISRIPLIAADACVIAFTWRNRVCRYDEDDRHGETLGTILLRDGSQYFIVLALLNIIHVILTGLSLDEVNGESSYITIFIDPISSILTCRFILNLRRVDYSTTTSTMPSGGDVDFVVHGSRSTLPRFIASFGEPLDAASVLEEDNELEEDARA